MDIDKSSGIILHPTALPSKYGIGDFGDTSKKFIDFLHDTSTSVWQVLPLGLTSVDEFSPYSSPSSILGNRYLIDIDKFSLKYENNIEPQPFSKKFVEYENVYKFKDEIFKNISQNINLEDQIYSNFLEDDLIRKHITFLILRDLNRKSWNLWDNEYQNYNDNLFDKLLKKNKNFVNFHVLTQYEFFNQWKSLKQYANNKNVNILGDIPIYVNHDSADVWLNKDMFEIDENFEMEYVSGAVPDSFNVEGQIWGNTLYKWDAHKDDNFKYWKDKLNRSLDLYDYLRIDHFIGFFKFWTIPKGKSALDGHWRQGPKLDFFESISKDVDLKKLLAEDLGVILKETKEILEKYNIPGMKVLQQRIPDNDENLPYLGDTEIINKKTLFEEASDDYFEETHPNEWNYNLAAYTGTHDSPTIKQWLDEAGVSKYEKFINYTKSLSNTFDNDVWNFISLVWESNCQLAVTTIQDLLQLDSKARFNIPGTAENNWIWRLEDLDILESIKKDLKMLNKSTNRA